MDMSAELTGEVLDSMLKLVSLNRSFDPREIRTVFTVLDVSPRVHWHHVIQACDLAVMFDAFELSHTHSPNSPGAVRAILSNLLVTELPGEIPGMSVVDSPWLSPFSATDPDTSRDTPRKRPHHFSTIAQLETTCHPQKFTRMQDQVILHRPGTLGSQITPTIPYPPAGFQHEHEGLGAQCHGR